MGIRLASFDNEYDRGTIIYESVSMAAFSPILRSEEEAIAFLDWVDKTYGSIFECDSYMAYERWVKER